MKKIFLMMIVFMTSIVGVVLMSCSSEENDDYIYGSRFKVDGIYYDILSEANSTCQVVSSNSYEGYIDIPSKVKYKGKTFTVAAIGEGAFSQGRVTGIYLPNTIVLLDKGAFANCSELNNITIPSSVTKIGQAAFLDCSGLTNITIPNSVTEIGTTAFYNCSGLRSVTIPNSVTKIGESAFNGCSGLTSVTIPNSITSIGQGAFYGCSGLRSVTIPNSITSIGQAAFGYCSGLTSIEIPNSVTSIDSYAFSGCDALTTLYSLNLIPPRMESGSFDSSHYDNLNVFVLQEALMTYKSANVWKNFKNLKALTQR